MFSLSDKMQRGAMYVVTRLVEMQDEKSNNVSLLSVDGGEVGNRRKEKKKAGEPQPVRHQQNGR